MFDFVGNFGGQCMLYNRVVIVQNHDLANVSAHRSWATCLPNVSFSGSSGAFQHKQTGLYSQMLQTSDPKTTGQLFTGTPGPPVSKPSEGAVPGTLTLSVLVTQMGLFLCKSWGILSGACWAIKLPLLFSLNGFAVWRFISPC